ncbi:MAG: TrmH family RNA methyltransferase [Longimicrobiales bacterium]|jgi:TrmH family RNA methyltransferase
MGLSQRRATLLGRLSIRRQREREGLVLVEGLRNAREALDAGVRVRFAVLRQDFVERPEGRAIGERMREAGIDVDLVEDSAFDALSATESPQGVLLVCEQEGSGLGEVVSAEGPILVLDSLQDPGNVGTLIRSAIAFGFAGVIALDGTADPWSPKAVRSSAGTVLRARIARAGAADAVEALSAAGRTILVAAAGATSSGVVEGPHTALVIGNEGAGVREEVLASADEVVSIPMFGAVESLNAGIAGSILMYELTRK